MLHIATAFHWRPAACIWSRQSLQLKHRRSASFWQNLPKSGPSASFATCDARDSWSSNPHLVCALEDTPIGSGFDPRHWNEMRLWTRWSNESWELSCLIFWMHQTSLKACSMFFLPAEHLISFAFSSFRLKLVSHGRWSWKWVVCLFATLTTAKQWFEFMWQSQFQKPSPTIPRITWSFNGVVTHPHDGSLMVLGFPHQNGGLRWTLFSDHSSRIAIQVPICTTAPIHEVI